MRELGCGVWRFGIPLWSFNNEVLSMPTQGLQRSENTDTQVVASQFRLESLGHCKNDSHSEKLRPKLRKSREP